MRNLTTVAIALAATGCTEPEIEREKPPVVIAPAPLTLEQAAFTLDANPPQIVEHGGYFFHQDDRQIFDHASNYYSGQITSQNTPSFLNFYGSPKHSAAMRKLLPHADDDGNKIVSRAEARRYREQITDLEEQFIREGTPDGKLTFVSAPNLKRATTLLGVSEDKHSTQEAM
ncbi:hypothetical protein COV18_03955 [Candidatus Woesearchaeota archaeon CG10_big_fil_rev_8_21_14_0_10_37_12]|nr:MAG: hypothetical protein COV18_03955 [Candidatus Woesearchaeota archaeon CG10_big_fil_rev_8_21_14_0_10_37_12]